MNEPRTGTGRLLASAWLLPLLLSLGACSLRPPSLPVPGPVELTARVRALLSTDDRSPAHYRRARVELEQLGPQLDNILLELAHDRRARPVARANALVLLAERRVPGAVSTLRWALLTSGDELVRAAAVMGLYRLVPEHPEAANAIRSAVADPSPNVRLNALQALDVVDIQTIRALLRVEPEPVVRVVAQQLLMMAESRGAPLAMEEGGVYRSAARDWEPRLIYRPSMFDESFEYAVGALGVELVDGTIIPLASDVEMTRGVLPAFFNLERTAVVIESARVIHIRDFERREAIYIGPGVAPRPIPLSDDFLFLREVEEERYEGEQGTELSYEIVQSDFSGQAPVRLGSFRVLARPEDTRYLSPVRWMTIGESMEGWALRVDGDVVFEFPHPEIEGATVARP
jgi:hypothetical protein